jgi:hypothetical protein
VLQLVIIQREVWSASVLQELVLRFSFPSLLWITLQSYVLQNDITKPTFNAISHEQHETVVNHKPCPSYVTQHFKYPHENITSIYRIDTMTVRPFVTYYITYVHTTYYCSVTRCYANAKLHNVRALFSSLQYIYIYMDYVTAFDSGVISIAIFHYFPPETL